MPSIEERVAALEAEVTTLREQLTDTHTLAAHADRDVAEFRIELRAQTQLLNINRQDMTDLREDVTGLREDVTGLREEMRAGFAQVGAGMTEIVRLLGEARDQG